MNTEPEEKRLYVVCDVKKWTMSHSINFNPLPHMPVLGSSNSAENKDDVKNIDKWGYNCLIE